jgi:uncharacterized protein (TIGR02145 family)
MKTMKPLLVAASFALALTFTFSGCSSDGNGGSDSTGGTSSPSGGGSSSSSCNPNATVTIGNQTWLKCNLNAMHNNGNGNSWCYAGENISTGNTTNITAEEGCARYGRIYDWYAAMNVPSDCNSCASQIQYPHRGLCPENFHIPTSDEWDELITAVGGFSTAGNKLKAKSGWAPGGNGTDEFGFSALPGGYRRDDGSFISSGGFGYWWTVTESSFGVASYKQMSHTTNISDGGTNPKSIGYSVRCVRDY